MRQVASGRSIDVSPTFDRKMVLTVLQISILSVQATHATHRVDRVGTAAECGRAQFELLS